MWICSRCQTANKDGYAQCVECSAPRDARRFGVNTQLNAPSVQTAHNERRMLPPEPRESVPSPRRQPQAEPAPARAGRAPGALARTIGLILAIALPVVTLLLSILRLDALKPLTADLFWGTAPAASSLPPDATLAPVASGLRPVLEWLVYALMALLAALLAAVPGLSLWSLGSLCQGIRRR